jgi:hypothetical protein
MSSNESMERKNEEPNDLNSSPSRIIKEDAYVAMMLETKDRIFMERVLGKVIILKAKMTQY